MTGEERETRRQIPFAVWLVVGSFTLRLVLLAAFWSGPHLTPLDFEDGDIARNLISGRGYSAGVGWVTPEGRPTAHKPPVYVGILYLSYKTFGESRFPPTLLNTFLIVGANLVLYLLLRRAFDETVARVAAVAYLLSPVTLRLHLSVTNTALATLLILAVLLAFSRFLDSPRYSSAALAGTLFGAALLTIPVSGVFAIPALWYALGARRALGGKKALVLTGTLFGVTVLVLLPWTLRNFVAFGEFVPVGSSLPLEFAIGNSPASNGGLVGADGSPVEAVTPEMIEYARSQGMNEVEAYRYYAAEAFRWSVAHPGKFLELRARSLFFFFLPQNFFYFPLGVTGAVAFLFTLAMVGLAVPGGILAWRRFPASRPLVQTVVWFTLVYTSTHANVNARYREPIDPLLIGLASLAAVSGYRRIRRRRGTNKPSK